MFAVNRHTGKQIVGVLAKVPVVYGIHEDSFTYRKPPPHEDVDFALSITASGFMWFQHTGDNEVHWTQDERVSTLGSDIFVDEDGTPVLARDIVLSDIIGERG